MERRGCPLFFPSSALPPEGSLDANPKAISERTSYSQVRLAFHFLPQVIRWNCTTNRFGPPFALLRTSPCPWQAHLASGLMQTTYIFALLTLGFPVHTPRKGLVQAVYINSLAHSSIGTRSPRHCCRAPTPCRHMVSGLFHSPHRGTFHLSLTVLVHYRSLRVFSLGS